MARPKPKYYRGEDGKFREFPRAPAKLVARKLARIRRKGNAAPPAAGT